MDLEQSSAQPNPDSEKGAKENSSAAGNHGDAHVNGLSNGYDRQKEPKSEHRSKERSHKSEHRDKDKNRDKEKSRKSEHRDKEREKDRHRHSSSSSKDKEKDRHSSSNKDKEKKSSSSSSSSKEHKSSSSSKDRDKSKDHHHKSSSSKDKDKSHSSSSKDKESSKSRDKDKDKHRHSSSYDKDKDKSKDKDRKHSSDKEKERHSSSYGDKDKSKSSDKDKHRHRHEKDKSKQKDKEERKQEEIKIKEDTKIKEELEKTDAFDNQQYQPQQYNIYDQVKSEPESMVNVENDGNSSDENGLYIKEDDDEDFKQENNSQNSFDGNDTRLSDLHNTTIKSEESDEDVPLASRTASPLVKRQLDSSDEDIPLSARKKIKKEAKKIKKKKKRKHSDDDEEDADNFEEKPKKKAAKKEKPRIQQPTNNTPSPRKKKKEEEEAEVWKWWEEDKKHNKDGKKWTFLEHKGPVFAPDYEPLPSSVKFYYNGDEMRLSQDAEEVATFYARMLNHDYTTKKAFNDNFLDDWHKVMTEAERKKIKTLEKCDFKPMFDYFVQKSEERKAMSKDEKKAIKEKNDEMLKEYGFCKIDGHKEKIGNFKIEPPGLFRGRGEHPKMGKLKKRVIPEDVSINCSKDSVIPQAPPGRRWKDVRHDPNVTWLASWTENVQGQVKYVMLNPSSKLKGEKDMQKYEIARKLAKSIEKIRAEYREHWKSKEMRIRQRAVALYFIDKLALRAGNEKDEDQADTVGCCSLRVEHISLHERFEDKENVVVFDFLGKDSIRYYNAVPVEKRVFKNLQLFKENKKDGDELFDRLDTTVMNKHLNTLMDGLTAKVFRTYNASWTLQEQLEKLTNTDDSLAEKILSYNRANRAVAILCNHQRAIPKTHAKSMENLTTKIEAKKISIKEAEQESKEAKREAKQGSAKGKDLYEKAKKKLERLKDQLTKLEVQQVDREENKTIALGTSKLNYLDPRISVAWCKKHDVPIEKIYNKTQRDKFRWAIDMAGPDYVF